MTDSEQAHSANYRLALVACVAAVVSAGVGGWGVYEAHHATAIATKALKLSTKPRVTMGLEEDPETGKYLRVEARGNEVSWAIRYKMRNRGGSTARNVRVAANIDLVRTGMPPPSFETVSSRPVDLPQDQGVITLLNGRFSWTDSCDCAGRFVSMMEAGDAYLLVETHLTYDSDEDSNAGSLRAKTKFGDGLPDMLEQVEGLGTSGVEFDGPE